MQLIEKEKQMNAKHDREKSKTQVDSSSSSSSTNKKAHNTDNVDDSVADFASPEGKSVITLAGNLAIGGGNFIVINTTDGKENIEEILERINKISPNAVTRVIEALADKISREK